MKSRLSGGGLYLAWSYVLSRGVQRAPTEGDSRQWQRGNPRWNRATST